MADDDHGPVWSRNTRHRSGGNPLIGFLVTLLALFGAVTAVLAIKERSVAEGGAILDGWISTAWTEIKKATGQADEVAAEAADEVGEAAQRTGNALEAGAEKTGDALEAGAETTRDELKKGG